MLENYILQVFPFMSQMIGRGVFYVIVATFCFGKEMGGLGIFGGVMMLVSGVLTIILYTYKSPPQQSFVQNLQTMESQGYTPPQA